MLQSSKEVEAEGEVVSTTEFKPDNWFKTEVPSTILATLWQNHVYNDLYTGTHMQEVDTGLFQKPWWYRTRFPVSPEEAMHPLILHFDGINYRANIWINGHLLADTNRVYGAFRRFRFEISRYVQPGMNILAVEVFPPQPGDYSTGFVDWNIDPPDRNMGIFREVILHAHQGVAIENPFVESRFNTENPEYASLTVHVDLVNDSGQKQKGLLTTCIDSLKIQKQVTIAAGQRMEVRLSPEEYLELNIQNPKLWWPNNLGNPSMYKLEFEFETDGGISDRNETAFGIRMVEDYFTPEGHRGFKINGQKVLIKGAGWTDDLLLMDTPQSLEAQIRYVRHLNLNGIRLEGFWGKDQTLYDLCDRYGILIMAGWSCQWEHEEYLGKPVDPLYGGITQPEDINLIAESWKDQLLWLRNHPSVFVWNVGSDKIPHPDLERRYVEMFHKYDPTRPYLNSTGGVGSEQGVITDVELVSEISGSSGMKMLGPYAYTPPVYWYTDKKLGGAYGFNTETCPGANIPPLESIKKMIPPKHLWPVDEVWEYHCGKNNFRSLDRIITAIEKRYGASVNVEDLSFKAQLLNYELMRPMFEAFRINIPRTTGIIQWMLNSAWPRMYWQLYDHYLMPNGAFYATRNACNPLHLVYHYGDHSVYLINEERTGRQNLSAHIKILDLQSRILLDQHIKTDCREGSSTRIFTLPGNLPFTSTWFLYLQLRDHTGRVTDRNFYWLSRKQDILDYDFTFEDWPFYTPSKQYADFSGLHELKPVTMEVSAGKTEDKNGSVKYHIRMTNPEKHIAFFTELSIKDIDNGFTLLPVLWEDNYVSLLPDETRELSVELPAGSRDIRDFILEVNGWNTEKLTLQL